MCEICLKFTKRYQNDVTDIVPVSLLLAFNKFHLLFFVSIADLKDTNADWEDASLIQPYYDKYFHPLQMLQGS